MTSKGLVIPFALNFGNCLTLIDPPAISGILGDCKLLINGLGTSEFRVDGSVSRLAPSNAQNSSPTT